MPTVLSRKGHLRSIFAMLAKPAPRPDSESAILPKMRTRPRKRNTAQKRATTSTTAPRAIQPAGPPARPVKGPQTFSVKKGPKVLHLEARAQTSTMATATMSERRSQTMVPRAFS